jgi:hypothetical protein
MTLIHPYDGPPDKQRLIAALRGQPTDRVPNFEVLIEDQHVERLLGRKAGNTLGVGGDPAKGSEAAEGVRPMYPADYRDYKRRYGHRVSLSGNIDITWPLVQGTPEDVERDVREHMDVLKPGGRWIAGSSHSIVNYIPHENFAAMINAIHKYGRY